MQYEVALFSEYHFIRLLESDRPVVLLPNSSVDIDETVDPIRGSSFLAHVAARIGKEGSR